MGYTLPLGGTNKATLELLDVKLLLTIISGWQVQGGLLHTMVPFHQSFNHGSTNYQFFLGHSPDTLVVAC